jgi:hypothetical protein
MATRIPSTEAAMSPVTDERTPAPIETSTVEAGERPQPVDGGAWLRERIPGTWAAGVALAWYGLYAIAVLVEPATHHEEPLIGEVLMAALLAAMIVTAAGLLVGQRWGLVASLAGGALMVAMSVACPTTGHHTIGLWWFAQMACCFALVGVSVTALRRT